METYKVAPFDQNLWVHGKYLTDPTKTLGELRIFPKSLIYLRADEPSLPGTNAQRNSDIFNERNRPTWSKSSINVVYLISRNFVEVSTQNLWQDFDTRGLFYRLFDPTIQSICKSSFNYNSGMAVFCSQSSQQVSC